MSVLLTHLFFLFGQRFLDNPRADSRQSSHAGVLWFRICLLPFWGLATPAGRKKGEMKYSLLWESMANFCILAVFERYISNPCTDPHQILFVYGQCLLTCPIPCGVHRPLGEREGGVKNSTNWGVSFVLRTATNSVFLSDAKCGPICTTQTCAHSGIEPSNIWLCWPLAATNAFHSHNLA